jgi:hypothetical protein
LPAVIRLNWATITKTDIAAYWTTICTTNWQVIVQANWSSIIPANCETIATNWPAIVADIIITIGAYHRAIDTEPTPTPYKTQQSAHSTAI